MWAILALGTQKGRQFVDQIARLVGVAHEGLDDLGHIDFAVVWVPAVVVGDHRDGGIAKLCFAREFGFGHIGHADDVAAPAFAVHFGFRQCGKLRSFHRQIGAAAMHVDACGFGRGFASVRQARAGWMCNRDMRHAPGAKERLFTCKGAVNELIYNDKIARSHRLAERTAGRDRDHIGHAKPFQRIDIGAVRHGGRRVPMPTPVTRQEGHFHAVQAACQDLVRRCAPRGFNRDPLRAFKPIDVVNSRAADHGNHGLFGSLGHSGRPCEFADFSGCILGPSRAWMQPYIGHIFGNPRHSGRAGLFYWHHVRSKPCAALVALGNIR